jgi:mannose-1-phosphate guanylyltransferase
MKFIPVILAGGSGTRFWPLSRKNSPKHVLNIDGNDTMIGQAISRFEAIAERSDVHIVTTSQQHAILKDALNPDETAKYIFEPDQKGTSACILMSALKLQKEYGDCVICVSPSDHYITLQEEFNKTIRSAIESAENEDKIVTIGITPTFPSTGYGYISCNFDVKSGEAFKVNEFIEKPDYNKAKKFISEGNYFWNSGIFVFKASVIIENFKRFLPRVYDKLSVWYEYIGKDNENMMLNEIYPTIQNISIDYGVMERSNDIYVIPASMGWNDIGSWDSLGCIFPPDEEGNIKRAKTVTIDTKNCVIFSEKSLIATIGLENMIIVDCPDALLVCPKSEAQRVKSIVDKLKIENLEEYL